MNRREALQAGLSVLASAGIDGQVATISPVNPQMIVFSIPGELSDESRAYLRSDWKAVSAGTKLEGIPVIITQNGMKLEIIDAPA